MNHFEQEMTFRQTYLPQEEDPYWWEMEKAYEEFCGNYEDDYDDSESGFDYPDELAYDFDDDFQF